MDPQLASLFSSIQIHHFAALSETVLRQEERIAILEKRCAALIDRVPEEERLGALGDWSSLPVLDCLLLTSFASKMNIEYFNTPESREELVKALYETDADEILEKTNTPKAHWTKAYEFAQIENHM